MLEPYGGTERLERRWGDLEQLEPAPDRIDKVGVGRIGSERVLVDERQRIVFPLGPSRTKVESALVGCVQAR